MTTNASVDEIGERCRLNHVIVVKLYHPYTYVTRNVRLSRRRIVTFLIIAPDKYRNLLTDQFLVDGSSMVVLWHNLQTR